MADTKPAPMETLAANAAAPKIQQAPILPASTPAPEVRPERQAAPQLPASYPPYVDCESEEQFQRESAEYRRLQNLSFWDAQYQFRLLGVHAKISKRIKLTVMEFLEFDHVVQRLNPEYYAKPQPYSGPDFAARVWSARDAAIKVEKDRKDKLPVRLSLREAMDVYRMSPEAYSAWYEDPANAEAVRSGLAKL